MLTALAAGAVLLAAFAAWERRTAHPMLPFGYFTRRGFAAANAVAFGQQISLIGALFMISQLLQIGMGYSPLGAGLRILVWNGTLMVVAPIAGILADRFGNRPIMVLGMLIQGAGLGWLAAVMRPGTGYGALVVPLVVAGVGISMGFPTVANMVAGSVPPEDVGVAAGTNSALREMGSVFGVAIIALVFAGQGGYGSPADFIDGFRPAMAVAAAIALLAAVPAAFGPGSHTTTQEKAV